MFILVGFGIGYGVNFFFEISLIIVICYCLIVFICSVYSIVLKFVVCIIFVRKKNFLKFMLVGVSCWKSG